MATAWIDLLLRGEDVYSINILQPLQAFSLLIRRTFPKCSVQLSRVAKCSFPNGAWFPESYFGVVDKCSCSYLLIFYSESLGGRSWLVIPKQREGSEVGLLYNWLGKAETDLPCNCVVKERECITCKIWASVFAFAFPLFVSGSGMFFSIRYVCSLVGKGLG